MHLDIKVLGIEQAQRRVASMPGQMRYAGARALNDTAFRLRQDWTDEMARVFDRPTPYILRSVYVGKRATKTSLEAWIYPREQGGKGIDPEKTLMAEVFGGVRRAKASEVALRRAGILPNNMAAVPAKWLLADPSAGDGYGGVKGSYMQRLLSYLQAFTSAGDSGNMSARRRAQLSGKGRWINGRFYGAHTKKGASRQGAMAVRAGGIEYFVSRGRGERSGRGSWKNGQNQHLPAGIWQRSGLYGVDVKPVFLFTRMPRYRARLDLAKLTQRAMSEHLPPLFHAYLRQALATAR